MLCVSRPEGAETDGKSGETEDDEDACVKLPIPVINFLITFPLILHQ